MSDIAAAFAYAGDHSIPIVNASLGGGDSPLLESVIAEHPNTLYVVAAGNDHADDDAPATASYPCAYPDPNIVCVGATDQSDNRATFSNFGAHERRPLGPGREHPLRLEGRARTPTGC